MMRWGVSRAAMVIAVVIALSTPGTAEARALRASGAAEPVPSSSVPIGSSSVDSTPSFSADPSVDQGHPGERVTLNFASNDTAWVIIGCQARFGDAELPCSGSPDSDWSVELTVPADATPGPTTIPWRILYESADDVGGTHDGPAPFQDGTTPFTVLSPAAASPSATAPLGSGGGAESASPSRPAPSDSLPAAPPAAPASNDHSFPIGAPLLLVILVAAALAATLIGLRRRAAAVAAPGAGTFAGTPPFPGAAQSVRVVPHPDTAIQVTVDEGPADRTHVVRIEPHQHLGTVEVREARG